jgi:hypothetical protein
MSTTREEAIVSLGVDSSAIARGMAVAKSKFTQFGDDMVHSFRHVAKEFGGAFLAGGIVAGIENILSKFQQMRNQAENLGISTDFLQGMEHLSSEKVVGGVEKFNHAIAALSTTLGEAKSGNEEAIKKFEKWGITLKDISTLNAEEMFYKIADEVKKIPDPAMRSAVAFELMGKSGKQMVGVLSEGSEEIRKLVGEAAKLDEETVKALAESKDKLVELENTTTIWGGRILALFTHDIPDAIGQLSVGFTNLNKAIAEESEEAAKKWLAAKMKKISDGVDAEVEAEEKVAEAKKKAATTAELFQRGNSPAQLKEKADILKKEAELAFKQLEDSEKISTLNKDITSLEKEKSYYTKGSLEWLRLDVDEQQKKLELKQLENKEHEKTAEILKKQREAKRHDMEEFMPSLDDLRHSSKFGGDARKLRSMERDIRTKFLSGDTKGAEAEIGEHNRLYDSLSDKGVLRERRRRVKIEELSERTTKSVEAINTFVQSLKGKK